SFVSVNGNQSRKLFGKVCRPFADKPNAIIVDNTDLGFTRMDSQEWVPMPEGEPVGISYLQHETDVGRKEWAEWNVVLHEAGKYDVQVYIPNSILPLSHEVEYTIRGVDSSLKLIDQQSCAGKWVSLGVFDLVPGGVTVRGVNLSKEDGRYFVADAVKFVKQAQCSSER
ncbi:MAG: hypothetical protein QME62_11565, partial [Armatimonadota bacterium]|nr:hypothetical protein [Armatimonadota bacterium]